MPAPARKIPGNDDPGPSVEAFENFYETTKGQYLANEIENLLSRSWGEDNLSRCHVLCIGYPAIGSKSISRQGASFALLTPGFMGVKKMKHNNLNFSFVGDEAHMPIHPASYDRIFILHTLEYSEDQVSFMEETWKVLSPGGKLFLMVPNKKGAWKKSGVPRTSSTNGYLFKDIKKLLTENGFTISSNHGASYGLPVDFFGKVLFSGLLKSLSGGGAVGFPGFLIFEAEKITNTTIGRPARTLKASPVKPVAS